MQFELGQEYPFLSRKAEEESEGRQGCWHIDALVVTVLFTGQMLFLIAQSVSSIGTTVFCGARNFEPSRRICLFLRISTFPRNFMEFCNGQWKGQWKGVKYSTF